MADEEKFPEETMFPTEILVVKGNEGDLLAFEWEKDLVSYGGDVVARYRLVELGKVSVVPEIKDRFLVMGSVDEGK